MKQIKVVISGRVQGVWFRGWTREEARRRGLSGWVLNRRDGTVEAVFEGEDERVDDMVEACWSGPPHAVVAEVRTEAGEEPLEPGFHVRSAGWL